MYVGVRHYPICAVLTAVFNSLIDARKRDIGVAERDSHQSPWLTVAANVRLVVALNQL